MFCLFYCGLSRSLFLMFWIVLTLARILFFAPCVFYWCPIPRLTSVLLDVNACTYHPFGYWCQILCLTSVLLDGNTCTYHPFGYGRTQEKQRSSWLSFLTDWRHTPWCTTPLERWTGRTGDVGLTSSWVWLTAPWTTISEMYTPRLREPTGSMVCRATQVRPEAVELVHGTGENSSRETHTQRR